MDRSRFQYAQVCAAIAENSVKEADCIRSKEAKNSKKYKQIDAEGIVMRLEGGWPDARLGHRLRRMRG
jgi:hypothetical protein